MSYLRRELLINITFLLLTNALIKPYYIFFVERTIQNEAGVSLWGIYFTIYSLSMVPQILLDLGITNYINKELATDKSKIDHFWKTGIWTKPMLAFLFFIVFFIMAWIGGYFHTHFKLVLWIGVNQILSSWILFGRAFLSGIGKYRWDSYFSIGDKFLFSLFFLFAFLKSNPPLDRFLAIQTITLTISAIVCTWTVTRHLHQIIPKLNWSILVKMIKASIPYALIFIIMVLFCRMEPVWIDQLRVDGAEQAGHFAAAYRIVDASNMMGFLFAGLLLSMFSRSLAENQLQELQSLFDLSWKLMIAMSVIISMPICFSHESIMNLLYDHEHGKILDWVILSLVPLTINYLLSTFITASGHIRQMNKWFLVSIVVNVILHLLFTKQMGARGAALSALITQLFTSVLLIFLIKLHDKVHIHRPHFQSLLIMLCVSVIIGYVLHFIPMHFILKTIIHASLITITFMALGYIPIRSLVNFLKSKL